MMSRRYPASGRLRICSLLRCGLSRETVGHRSASDAIGAVGEFGQTASHPLVTASRDG